MAKPKSVKVGSVMTLSCDDGRKVPLRPQRGHDVFVEGFLFPEEAKVRVLSIAFFRRDLKGNSLWLEVQSVKNPEKKGWLPFDPGGWEDGFRVQVTSVDFVKR